MEGRELLRSADGLSQFFDRDTSEDLATVAMKGFQEFMLHPQRADAVLPAIERARSAHLRPRGGTARLSVTRAARHRAGWSTAILLAPALHPVRGVRRLPDRRQRRLSLLDWNGAGPTTYVGLGNYRELFADPGVPQRARQQPALARC